LSRPCTALNATRAASHILGTRSPATSAFAFGAQCVNHTSEKCAVHALQTLHHLQPQVAASICLRPKAIEVPEAFELELRLDVCLGHRWPSMSACASGHERCHKQLSCPTEQIHASDVAAALSLLGCILLHFPCACVPMHALGVVMRDRAISTDRGDMQPSQMRARPTLTPSQWSMPARCRTPVRTATAGRTCPASAACSSAMLSLLASSNAPYAAVVRCTASFVRCVALRARPIRSSASARSHC